MPEQESRRFSLYVLRCRDGSLYTGIACDVEARLEQHRNGQRGAKYLRGRGPVTLVFRRAVGDLGRALALEHRVKKLPRRRKLALIDGTLDLDELGA